MVFNMQFYLGKTAEEPDLIEQVAQLLGLQVATLEHPNDLAPAYMMVTPIAGDFPCSVSIDWVDVVPLRDNVGVALGLARHYDASVVTDLPGDHQFAGDPFWWCMAEPNGEVVQISQDIEQSDNVGGLMLKESTRSRLQNSGAQGT